MKGRFLLVTLLILSTFAALAMTLNYHSKSKGEIVTTDGQHFYSQNIYTNVMGNELEMIFKLSSFLDSNGADMVNDLSIANNILVTITGNLPEDFRKQGLHEIKMNALLKIGTRQETQEIGLEFNNTKDQIRVSIEQSLRLSGIDQKEFSIIFSSSNISLIESK